MSYTVGYDAIALDPYRGDDNPYREAARWTLYLAAWIAVYLVNVAVMAVI